MGNIVDYVKDHGNQTMTERAFNELDALVLSEFVYMKWEHIIPRLEEGRDSLSLKQMKNLMESEELYGEVFMDERYADDHRALFDAMLLSRRFGSMKCNYLVEDKSKDIETQFFAITVFLKGALPVMVFRGTDETMLGWKEDFNMAYKSPVPGQRLASLYIKQVALRLSGGFVTTGHSKGGNLAVYSVLTAPDGLADRVMRIYDFDGPGFKNATRLKHDYDRIKDKVCKIVPESSIVGVILEHPGTYRAVTSTAKGAFQHNPYSWVINDGDFEYVDDVKPASRLFRDAITTWMDELSPIELETVFGTIYDIIATTGAETTIELRKDKKAPVNMLKALIDLPEDTKERMKALFKELKNQIQ